jgi:hypothetical protein
MLAGVLVARFAKAISPRLLFAAGMIGLGLTDLGVANAARFAMPGAPAVAVASAFMVLAGFPVVATAAARAGLLQGLTEDAFRGRVFGALNAVQGLAILAGLALGGLAIDTVGVVPIMSIGAASWIGGGLFALARLPRDIDQAVSGAESAAGP